MTGCTDRRRLKRGLCPKHYQKWLKYGDPLHPPQSNAGRFKPREVSASGEIFCRRCKQWLPTDQFRRYRRVDSGHKRDGYWDSSCKLCRVESFREWRRANPMTEEQYRKKAYAQRYGLTLSAYDALFEQQAGRCGICGEVPSTRLAVDHNHETGAVRGLLCGNCNRGLGMFKENRENLERAIKWLEEGES